MTQFTLVEGCIETNYTLSNPVDFFESINDWLNYEGEHEATISIVNRADGTMILVDGCDDERRVLAIESELIIFNDDAEIEAVVNEFVDRCECIEFMNCLTFH